MIQGHLAAEKGVSLFSNQPIPLLGIPDRVNNTMQAGPTASLGNRIVYENDWFFLCIEDIVLASARNHESLCQSAGKVSTMDLSLMS